MKNSSLLPMMGMILLGLLGYAGCEPDSPILNEIASGLPVSTTTKVSTNTRAQSVPARAQETLLIASFNIQVFGESKMNDRWVMERLAEVIRRFDIVAIQEVRSTNQTLLPTLVNYVNALGGRYDYLLGPRLGRTVSKEQYAYVYDAARVLTCKDCSYTLNDDIDLLHREPLIARFVARTSLTNRPWTFSLVNLHTDPDEAIAEVEAMGSILREIRNYEFMAGQEDDVILLGDFNAAPAKMRSLQTLAGMRPLVVNQTTNVKETQLYDNILIEPVANAEFTGLFGVLSLRDFFGITMDDALKLSDHNPVWAEFLVEERSSYSQQQMATQPFVGVR
jgi:endonuclease/exonuclease/phosphatase family metal-dependent hydrolase